jgi:hypothetical protein
MFLKETKTSPLISVPGSINKNKKIKKNLYLFLTFPPHKCGKGVKQDELKRPSSLLGAFNSALIYLFPGDGVF